MELSNDGHQPFKPLHGQRQGLIELLNDATGRVQAAVLKLQRVTMALVNTGQTSELRGQQRAMVEGHDLGWGALLGEGAEGIRGRRSGH